MCTIKRPDKALPLNQQFIRTKNVMRTISVSGIQYRRRGEKGTCEKRGKLAENNKRMKNQDETDFCEAPDSVKGGLVHSLPLLGIGLTNVSSKLTTTK